MEIMFRFFHVSGAGKMIGYFFFVRGVCLITAFQDLGNTLMESFSLDLPHFFINDFTNFEMIEGKTLSRIRRNLPN